MSGIINSAGSRTGVIGTTELDYEEGEWTPVLANDTDGLTLREAHYRVFGDLVFAHFAFLINTTSDASAINFSFPFTCSLLANAGNYQGGFLTTNGTGHIAKPVISRGANTAHIANDSGALFLYNNWSGENLAGMAIYIRA